MGQQGVDESQLDDSHQHTVVHVFQAKVLRAQDLPRDHRRNLLQSKLGKFYLLFGRRAFFKVSKSD